MPWDCIAWKPWATASSARAPDPPAFGLKLLHRDIKPFVGRQRGHTSSPPSLSPSLAPARHVCNTHGHSTPASPHGSSSSTHPLQGGLGPPPPQARPPCGDQAHQASDAAQPPPQPLLPATHTPLGPQSIRRTTHPCGLTAQEKDLATYLWGHRPRGFAAYATLQSHAFRSACPAPTCPPSLCYPCTPKLLELRQRTPTRSPDTHKEPVYTAEF